MGYKVGEYVVFRTQNGSGWGKIETTEDTGSRLQFEIKRPGITAYVYELQILASLTEDDVELCDKFWGKKVAVSSKDKKRPGRVIDAAKDENGLNFLVLYLDTLDVETKRYRHSEMTIVEE